MWGYASLVFGRVDDPHARTCVGGRRTSDKLADDVVAVHPTARSTRRKKGRQRVRGNETRAHSPPLRLVVCVFALRDCPLPRDGRDAHRHHRQKRRSRADTTRRAARCKRATRRQLSLELVVATRLVLVIWLSTRAARHETCRRDGRQRVSSLAA